MPESSVLPRQRAPRLGKDSRALVVDGHATSRNILAAQLRSVGVGHVSQCARAGEARRQMASRAFDIVVLELRLGDGTAAQDLIDELRRRGMLPLSTVVMVVSSQSSYDVVAGVAESAIDGFLIKPYSEADLEERLMRALARKDAMKAAHQAVEDGRWEDGLRECEERFLARGAHWSHAARLGAELAIRLGRLPLASAMFEAVLADRAVPWAKLGIARVLDATDHKREAASTIRDLLDAEPTYSDAYDVLAKIHAEQGDYDAAIRAYRQAAQIMPGSVVRQQRYGMLCWYAGEQHTGARALQRALEIGGESPLFDPQTLLLLAIDHCRRHDDQGLADVAARLAQAIERPGRVGDGADRLVRLRRLMRMVRALQALRRGDRDLAEAELAQASAELGQADFDVEAAINLLTVLAIVHADGSGSGAAAAWVRTLGLRFCVSRQVTEVLARATEGHPSFPDALRAAYAEIGETTRLALSDTLIGQHQRAVEKLLDAASATRNARLLEVATATLGRHRERIAGHAALAARCEALRRSCGAPARALLGGDEIDPTIASIVSGASRPAAGGDLR